MARLRYILNYHGIQTRGTKEELVLRLLYVCQARYLCYKGKEYEIMKTIYLAEDIICAQKKEKIVTSQRISRKRARTKIKGKSNLVIPENISFQNLQDIFKELRQYVKILKEMRRTKDNELHLRCKNVVDKPLSKNGYEEYFYIGTTVKVK